MKEQEMCEPTRKHKRGQKINLVINLPVFLIISFNSVWNKPPRNIYLLTLLHMLKSYMCQLIPECQTDPATETDHHDEFKNREGDKQEAPKR